MVARSVKSSTNEIETPGETEAHAAEVGAELTTGLPQAEPMPMPEPEPELAELPEPEFEQDRLPRPEPLHHGKPDPAPPPTAIPRPELTTHKVGFGPVFFGGIVAAALGYAAAYFGQQPRPADLTPLIVTQTDRITALEAQLSALPAPVDLSPLLARLGEMQGAINARQAEAATALAALETRLSEVERTPNADGTLSETAIVAWEAELQNLRAEVTAQQARMQELADAATAQLDQTRIEAASIEQTATESVAAVTARAALARVQAALDAGTPFDAALADLAAATPVPETLTALATDGVPTMLALQTDFPDAARAALAVARSEGLAGEDGGGIAAFLRNQFDVRSVTPQEGTTADAILSRAEEDLRQNRLSDALAEVASLPEVVRAEMSGWISAAETRTAALATVEGLSEILTQN